MPALPLSTAVGGTAAHQANAGIQLAETLIPKPFRRRLYKVRLASSTLALSLTAQWLDGKATFNITQDVQRSMNSPGSYYGWLLKATDESTRSSVIQYVYM